MRLHSAAGSIDIAYLDGAAVEAALEGVMFALRISDETLCFAGFHPESEDNMIRYSLDQRTLLGMRAAAAAANDNPPLYTAEGEEAWVA